MPSLSSTEDNSRCLRCTGKVLEYEDENVCMGITMSYLVCRSPLCVNYGLLFIVPESMEALEGIK